MLHRVLPQPQFQGQPLRVVTHVEPPELGQFPVTISVVPTMRAGATYSDIQSLTVIANTLRLVARRHIDAFTGWAPARSNARTVGVVIMENWNNASHANARQDVRLSQITAGLLLELFEEVTFII